ncbi:TetR/AcrR family transcriptional regulator [Sphingomonas profundi]|uniref:TetR/AcrR family transcriptional regulator n=1 Tax=Alterirhizorhabdus profundi TaxID=2681549 RepID=UPI0012E79652|nr:helix-turn-helix domain-containing protein [Sphingomonas profundi]
MDIVTASDERLGASARRRSHRPEVEATRLRILRAAERLYAERGFDGASLREIAIAANQGNNNAVQYHFGSRDKLIDAIFHQRVAEMESERQALLDQAEADGRLADTGTLLTILSVPHLSLCDDRGHHPHAGFLLHYLIRRMPDGTVRGLSTAFTGAPAMCRLLNLIQQLMADLPTDIAQTRVTLCALMFLNLLVQHDAANPQAGDPVALARHATDTIEAMTAALSGPCSA